MVRAVLFDADGVLIDACELHYVAFNNALAEHGWTLTREEHNAAYNGLPTQKKLELLTRHRGFPKEMHARVHATKQDFTLRAIDQCLRVDTSKKELLVRLKEAGLKIAVCSNSLRSSLDRMLGRVGILALVDVVIGSDNVSNPKPSPDMYLCAAALLGARIEQCVIVEDSPVGLQAAYAAEPYEVIEVDGPHQVNSGLAHRIMRHQILQEEVA